MSVQVSYKKQILVYVIISIILLVFTEIFIRYLDSFEPKCEFIKSEIFSNFNESIKNQLCSEYNSLELEYTLPIGINKPNQYGTFVNINSDGLRGDEIQENNTYRIIFLGGSTTFGIVSTSDETTIPALVEKKLFEKKIVTEVINAGINGASSIDEFYFLENKLLKFNPDMVVMYDGWNDVNSYNFLKNNIEFEEYKNNSFYENNQYVNLSFTNNLGKILLQFLIDIDYKTGIGLIIFFRDFANISNYNQNEYLIENNMSDLNLIEKNLKNNWSKVCNLGNNYSFITINFIQPGIDTGIRTHSNEEKIFLSQTNEINKINNLKELNIKNLQSKNCKFVFDLRNTFDQINDKTIFFDSIHVSDYGNEIISEKIKDILIPIIQNN